MKKNLNKKRVWFNITKYILLAIVLISILFFALFIYYAKDLPRPEVFEERQLVQPTKIYDRTGEVLLYTIYGEEKRELVKLEDIPDNLINAVLATEDANFYKHKGIDLKGILRAIMIDLKLGNTTYGGSTISQQLIRSTFLTREKSIKRKFREIVLTIELERHYSKDQILEWYLNQISLGPNVYGVGEAAKNFFNKSVKELTLPECAVLAAVIKAPSFYNPFGDNVDRLLIRKDYVLERMFQEGFISEEECQEAKEEELEFIKTKSSIKAPHFVLYVRQYLFNKYGEEFLKENGLKVYTTLDWELQEKAENILKEEGERIKYYNANNAAAVIINPNNGEILSMIGSKDFFAEPYPEGCVPGTNCLFEPEVNVTVYGEGQQPGSAFKPFVYVTAFNKGADPDVVVIDEPTNFGEWGGEEYIPQNYDGLFRGPVTLRQALAQSLNIPSIKVLVYMAGIEDSLQTAKNFGITTLNQPSSFYGPSLVLGGGEVKVLDIASAYGVFATNGLRYSPISILRIEDSKGNILEQSRKTAKRVARTDNCEMINDILSDNEARAPMFGTISSLYFPNDWIAAKTGTTNSYRDAWTIGYSRSVVIGVWAGNNNNDPMFKKPAVVISGPIWRRLMEESLKKY